MPLFPDPPADWPTPPPKDKLVVLHTRVVSETGGGPDKTILLSAPFLAHTEYWLAAAYMYPEKDPGFEVIRARAAKWNSPLIGIPDRGAFDYSVIRQMLQICRRYNVRIWHAHDYKSNFIGVLLRPFHRMHLVTTAHGWVKHEPRLSLYYRLDRFSLRFYERVIGVSDDLVDRCKQLGVPRNRLALVLNGIDERTFSRQFPSTDSPLRQLPPGRLLLGAVGRLSAEKGFDVLIRAVSALLKEGHDLELWIAGDGEQRSELDKLIANLGTGDRIKLLGFCEDTVAFYHALDLFILSSFREGLPNVVLEAMAMSVPVVATKVAGVPRLLTDGETGLLCEPGDLIGLTDTIRRAVTDPAVRDRLTRAARELIVKEYSFSERMRREKAIYDRLLSRA